MQLYPNLFAIKIIAIGSKKKEQIVKTITFDVVGPSFAAVIDIASKYLSLHYAGYELVEINIEPSEITKVISTN